MFDIYAGIKCNSIGIMIITSNSVVLSSFT